MLRVRTAVRSRESQWPATISPGGWAVWPWISIPSIAKSGKNCQPTRRHWPGISSNGTRIFVAKWSIWNAAMVWTRRLDLKQVTSCTLKVAKTRTPLCFFYVGMEWSQTIPTPHGRISSEAFTESKTPGESKEVSTEDCPTKMCRTQITDQTQSRWT